MIVILLIIVACVLLFGKEQTKGGLKFIGYIFLALLIAAQLASCGS